MPANYRWKKATKPPLLVDHSHDSFARSPPPLIQHQQACFSLLLLGQESTMPAKHILQLIIDILQRRDTYEIFAEPVDPNEVEDYYEIIKEPMDFGTMRAKLHEGMYKNLEQFKHDIFLITRNAMHFNSSATIYFRQARAIHELAKRVFHVLRTDPENFEMEFSGTRRRSTRTAHSEAKDFKLTTRVEPSAVTNNVPSKGTPSSVGKSTLRRNRTGSPWLASMAIRTNKIDCGFLFGGGRRSNSIETDHRCTYRPQSDPSGCDNNLVGSRCSRPNPLVFTCGQGVNYRESLLLFVKDLGPTAQMIATKKIRGLHEICPTCQIAGSTSSIGWGFLQTRECQVPGACGNSLRGSHSVSIIDLISTDAERREVAHGRKSMSSSGVGSSNTLGGQETVGNGNSNINIDEGVIKKRKRSTTEFWLRLRSPPNDSIAAPWMMLSSKSAKLLSSSSTTITTADDTAGGKLDMENVIRPVILALEHSHANSSNVSELKSLRNKKISCTATGTATQSSKASSNSTSNHQANGSTNSLGSYSCHGTRQMDELQGLESKYDIKKNKIVQGRPVQSPFTFNMCFLKAQLNQMNLVRESRDRADRVDALDQELALKLS